MENNVETEQYLCDAILGRPYGFSIGERHFAIYPVTLGKMFLLQRQIEALEINQQNLQQDMSLEALRLAKEKKDACLTIVCYNTFKTPEEIFDNALLTERKALFERELSIEDLSTLMIIVLTADKTSTLLHHLGIEKEQERLSTVMRVKAKSDKNSLSFGGKSVFGSLIDAACERYGWTKEYVVWGIDYASLRLMLADKVNSVYCSDEEMKKLPASVRNSNDETIRPVKENMERIMAMDWK